MFICLPEVGGGKGRRIIVVINVESCRENEQDQKARNVSQKSSVSIIISQNALLMIIIYATVTENKIAREIQNSNNTNEH